MTTTIESMLAFRQGERVIDRPRPCCDCGKESDCYASCDDGDLCKACCGEGDQR